jgi:hypothetical protein
VALAETLESEAEALVAFGHHATYAIEPVTRWATEPRC